MRRVFKTVATLLLVALLVPTPAPAQQTDDDEAVEPLRRYTVEVIVFRYTQDASVGNELFLPDEVAIDEFAFGDDIMPPEEAELEEVQKNIRPIRRFKIDRVDPADFTLNEVYSHLQRLDVYRPVMHFGWTQTTLPRNVTEARPLASLARPPRDLDGTLSLYLGRYLHLVVDLELQDDGEPPVTYRISEDRIFKNGDLRYFDHPKFGVLAKITRAEDTALLNAASQ